MFSMGWRLAENQTAGLSDWRRFRPITFLLKSGWERGEKTGGLLEVGLIINRHTLLPIDTYCFEVGEPVLADQDLYSKRGRWTRKSLNANRMPPRTALSDWCVLCTIALKDISNDCSPVHSANRVLRLAPDWHVNYLIIAKQFQEARVQDLRWWAGNPNRLYVFSQIILLVGGWRSAWRRHRVTGAWSNRDKELGERGQWKWRNGLARASRWLRVR